MVPHALESALRSLLVNRVHRRLRFTPSVKCVVESARIDLEQLPALREEGLGFVIVRERFVIAAVFIDQAVGACSGRFLAVACVCTA